MEDFPAKIADTLENIATTVRSMTVDRVAGWIVWAAAGIVILFLSVPLLVWLVVGIHRALGTLIGNEPAYAVWGGIFVLIGAFLWSKRVAPVNEDR